MGLKITIKQVVNGYTVTEGRYNFCFMPDRTHIMPTLEEVKRRVAEYICDQERGTSLKVVWDISEEYAETSANIARDLRE